jgi:uncharacterized protein (TIRG00374 family)
MVTQETHLFHRRIVPIIIIVIVLLGVVFVVLDWSEIQKVLGQASWQPLPFAILFTLISYFCISYSFGRVSKLLGIKMRLRDLTSVGFVTTVLNHVLTSGGAAGYSVRFMLMNRHGVSMKDVLSASILHYYLTSLVMIAMLPVGIIYLILHASIGQVASVILAVIAILILAFAFFASSLIFRETARRRILRSLIKPVRRILHRDIEETIERFDETMAQSIRNMREQPRNLITIMALVVIDWAASAVTLWFCFKSLNTTIGPGELISGFAIGIMAGVISLIPGGLGVQEGSMAGIFALLGVSFQSAVLASIMFRGIYLMTPYVISLTFYWRLLRTKQEDLTPVDIEVENANPDTESRISSHD